MDLEKLWKFKSWDDKNAQKIKLGVKFYNAKGENIVSNPMHSKQNQDISFEVFDISFEVFESPPVKDVKILRLFDKINHQIKKLYHHLGKKFEEEILNEYQTLEERLENHCGRLEIILNLTEEITEKVKFKEEIINDLREKMKNLDSDLIKQKEEEIQQIIEIKDLQNPGTKVINKEEINDLQNSWSKVMNEEETKQCLRKSIEKRYENDKQIVEWIEYFNKQEMVFQVEKENLLKQISLLEADVLKYQNEKLTNS